jgi:tRNA threonylcarbamoyladenosine biosynthesis protein TsaB
MSHNIPPTLFIETATPRCSVGLVDANGVWYEREVEGKGSHSRALDSCVNDLLNESGIETDALQMIVLGRGPGSFTGLRIGASFVRGLCFGNEIPVMMMDTLAALAARVCLEEIEHAGQSKSQEIHAIVDARRTHLYHWSGLWTNTPEGGHLLETTASQAIRPIEEVEAILSKSSSAMLTGFGMDRLTLKNPEIQRLIPPDHLSRGQKWLFETQNPHSHFMKTSPKDAVPLYLS